MNVCRSLPSAVGQRKARRCGDCHGLLSSPTSPSTMGDNCLLSSSWNSSLPDTRMQTRNNFTDNFKQPVKTALAVVKQPTTLPICWIWIKNDLRWTTKMKYYMSIESMAWSLSSRNVSSYVSSVDASSRRMMGRRLSLESELHKHTQVNYKQLGLLYLQQHTRKTKKYWLCLIVSHCRNSYNLTWIRGFN